VAIIVRFEKNGKAKTEQNTYEVTIGLKELTKHKGYTYRNLRMVTSKLKNPN